MENQMTVWGFYLAGCVLLGLVGWRITRPLPRYWQHFLQVSYWVLALTPYTLGLTFPAYAPAIFIVVLNTLFQGFESALDAAVLLGVVWLLALVLSLAYLILTRNRVAKKSNDDFSKSSDEDINENLDESFDAPVQS